MMWITWFKPKYPKWLIGSAPGGSCVYTPLIAIWARWSDFLATLKWGPTHMEPKVKRALFYGFSWGFATNFLFTACLYLFVN